MPTCTKCNYAVKSGQAAESASYVGPCTQGHSFSASESTALRTSLLSDYDSVRHPGPSAQSMSEGGTTPRNFNLAVQNNNCCPYNPKIPPFVPRQWGGRISGAEYQELQQAIVGAYNGTFNNPVCLITLFGCTLCVICACVEGCEMRKKPRRAIEDFNKKVSTRGIVLTWEPSFVNQYGTPVAFRIAVQFF
mmetsp:Transcript_3438/g.6518  ORF Transcript_3438/g.6518 Transcript_3438/m.6518 type:complete len:191 (+) Transcript_3438:37-609(+)|eukprot:CAMPEP_0175150844 /NCGR_PEP_ID=MMETSP0087-20121206/18125_1 /TAXON_ID=136419 /ORGANISM="Unknown Unknown, Strain D1" /LENGTH=190 /DNA_ID=CAMNT_0016436893 /DNA_START=37 /DNA_END=609 /DNA_ORIENTATION=+